MTVTYGFYNSLAGDRKYDAIQLSSIFDGIVADGIFQSVGTAFAVSVNAGMNINIGSGRAWLNHTWTYNDANIILTVEASDPTLDRIDTVIIEVNTDVATRANSIKIIAGTPASSPVAPTLENAGTLHQYPLADIAVGHGVTSIIGANITNWIGAVGGTPFITGVLETLNVSWLYAQWQSQFEEWFDNLVDQLTGEQVTNLQNQIDQLGPHPPIFKNLLINGDMEISQRGTSETDVTTTGYKKAPDRWGFIIASLGTWSVSQSTVAPAGLASSYKLVCTTAKASPASADLLVLKQRLEGQFLQKLKKGTADAKALTLSFWVRSNKTGTYIFELRDEPNGRHICASYIINSPDTWEYKTITFVGDVLGAVSNDSGNSLTINFWLGAGSGFSSGTLQTTWATIDQANQAVGQTNLADTINNELYLTGVQLESGSKATEFEYLPRDVNLIRCQRYYYTVLGNATGYPFLARYTAAGASAVFGISLKHPVTMRDNPSSINMIGTWSVNNASQPSPSSFDKNFVTILAASLAAGDAFFYAPNNIGFEVISEL